MSLKNQNNFFFEEKKSRESFLFYVCISKVYSYVEYFLMFQLHNSILIIPFHLTSSPNSWINIYSRQQRPTLAKSSSSFLFLVHCKRIDSAKVTQHVVSASVLATANINLACINVGLRKKGSKLCLSSSGLRAEKIQFSLSKNVNFSLFCYFCYSP